ncbi:MAG TPA: hypothetical protein VN933_05890 [Candidatus Eremiobacteraceae bacterium]|jgi:hypothetical protein|nr:hypothetical protein [Candidatus Eremiobacteraceae bacterium]
MLRSFRRSNEVAVALAGKASLLRTCANRNRIEATSRGSRRSQFTLAAIAILVCVAIALIASLTPRDTIAWGANAQRVIVGKAVDTLPPDLRPFFDENRSYLALHVSDPLDAEAKTPTEKHNHFIYLDRYGRFPYTTLPRVYKNAVSKYSKSKLEQTGLLPWQIGVYSAKLTTSFQQGHWDEAKLNAAILAGYVAEAHDPFNTTENFDGHLTLQNGINDRFGAILIDRFSSFFPLRPNDASFISDPTDHAFEACLSAHSVLETILLADRNARASTKAYNDEYFDHFYNLTAATLIRQLSEASTDVGSYWLTSWTNAGKPTVPQAQH